jgi:hypothetical protein
VSPLLKQVLDDVNRLTWGEKWQLVGHMMTQLQSQTVVMERPRKSWLEMAGLAPNLLKGLDAQDFVNGLRDEWDDREQKLRRS